MEAHERYPTILVFGAPGSGKGTQGRALGTLPGYFHLACGDVFRSLDPQSDVGKVFLECSAKGELVPDEITVKMWLGHIEKLVHSGAYRPKEEVLVLDGIPRNVHQAEMMEQYIDLVVLVCLQSTDEEALIRRIRRRALHENRLDDANEDVIRNRFTEYHAETEPVLQHYPIDSIRIVDTGDSAVAVLHRVTEVVEEAASSVESV